ncbi:MAG TPA: hypothetical protein H9740_05885 [Candidatus Hungatella pullicola]|nr:hypothetical protein [Candidatus Hungatella pullicola]
MSSRKYESLKIHTGDELEGVDVSLNEMGGHIEQYQASCKLEGTKITFEIIF